MADSRIPMVGLKLSVSRSMWINGWSETSTYVRGD